MRHFATVNGTGAPGTPVRINLIRAPSPRALTAAERRTQSRRATSAAFGGCTTDAEFAGLLASRRPR